MLPLTEIPPAPAHLSAAATGWWNSINENFSLEPHHLLSLEGALAHWDLWREALNDIQQRGAEAKDRFGTAKNRAAVERADRFWQRFERTMLILGLDVAPPSDIGRTPRPGTRYGGRA